MVAGNWYGQEGSAVLAKGDVSIFGKTVDSYLQAEGSIAATDGQFTSDAGRIALDAGGNIVLPK